MNKKILLIEDELELADNIKSILELNGFDVTIANNGLDGIKIAKAEIPDIIVSDILMPSKTGYEVLEILHSDAKTSHIPFIFLTAKVEHKDLRKGMELGADDYIFKPFHSKELINAIKVRLKRTNSFKRNFGKYDDGKYGMNDNIILNIKKNKNILQINKIIYIIAERQYSKVFLNDGRNVLLRKSLMYWESILPTNIFIRIHRKTIVNVQEINAIFKKSDGKYRAKVKNFQMEFEISRRYMKKLRQLFLI
jgi:DNA-binding response OmpR family regulator